MDIGSEMLLGFFFSQVGQETLQEMICFGFFFFFFHLFGVTAIKSNNFKK